MPNDYFQFKQFLVKQDKCAMKVCTDACLFGALIADRLPVTVNLMLDIGTGTGLLSLMLAQKLKEANIDAVEIDEAAAQQAHENFKVSIFEKQLKVYHNSIQQFEKLCLKKFDAVICNPPFYENDLKSENKQRNIALHSDKLSLNELISIADKLLTYDGNFFALLPFNRTKYFEDLLLKNNFKVNQKIFIKQTTKHNYFRTIFWVDRKSATTVQSEIIIMNEANEYSNMFKKLLRDYYFKLS